MPLIAVHLFVFYFGILADDTPPVGLAAYAAAAISGADPIKTGIQGFTYDIRTAILPFMFIFNTQLLLIGLTGWFDLVVTVVSAILAMLVFSAATQGYWLTKTRWWETLALLLITFTLFRPGFWWDKVYEPTEQVPGSELLQRVDGIEPNGQMIVKASGMALDGTDTETFLNFTLPEGETAAARLQAIGLEVTPADGRSEVDYVEFGSEAEQAGLAFGWTIDAVQVEKPRPPKELMFIPAVLLLVVIGLLQKKRARRETQGRAAAA